jgi:hypothetical protein
MMCVEERNLLALLVGYLETNERHLLGEVLLIQLERNIYAGK